MGSQKRLAQSAPESRMFYVVVSAVRNYNRPSLKLRSAGRSGARWLIFLWSPAAAALPFPSEQHAKSEKQVGLNWTIRQTQNFSVKRIKWNKIKIQGKVKSLSK